MIRKINVGMPPPNSGGQASNLRGKQLENWGLQGLRSSWLPGSSPPRTPDMGAMKGNHGSEVGISREQVGDLGEGDLGTFPSPHFLIRRSHSTIQHSGPPSHPFPIRGRLRMELPPTHHGRGETEAQRGG